LYDTGGMAKKGRRSTNDERFVAIQMYDNGLSVDQIMDVLKVGRSSVFDWISKYRAGGGSPRYPPNTLPVARPCWMTVR